MAAQQKILVLLDGSKRSLMTVDYLISMPLFRSAKLVLYNVFSAIPESYWDLEKEPASLHIYHELTAWERENRKKIDAYMALVRKRLINAGFAPSAIELKVHDREKGIARDILKEAEAGYHTVVLRRRGMGETEGLSMGSIATKLLSRITFLPIQIAGRKAQNKKVIIGVDGSESADQAVDYVAELLGGYDYSVGLIHIIRGYGASMPEHSSFFMPADSLKASEKAMREHFQKLREKLIDAGFQPEKVSEKIITGAHSRAGTIVSEAEIKNYSTIVLGRRGHSRVQEFLMGRVCQKVVHAGRYHTVWIV